MGQRSRHPNKEIEAAVVSAEKEGWRVKMLNGHGWGRLRCPLEDRTGCQISIWSTPKNPSDHARAILRLIKKCNCIGG